MVIGAIMTFITGVVVGQQQPLPSEDNVFPELGWAQTEEDMTPEPTGDSGLEPTTVRYVGTVQGVTLYIGIQVGSSNICIAVYPPDTQRWSTTCSALGAIAQVSENFYVAVGSPNASFLEGPDSSLTPRRISESVTVYLQN